MTKYIQTTLLFFCISIINNTASADPWFTGPIFAPAGHTVPRGHNNFEIYGLDVFTNGQFDSHANEHRTPLFRTVVANPLLTHGFTDRIDVQLSIPYAFNNTQGVGYNRLADISVGAGLQLLEQKTAKHPWIPDVRFYLQETFPTGKYELLNPAFLGTDATGLGSYRTMIAINFQYLSEIYNSHYLRTRLMISRQYSSLVNVNGLNSFGGSINTQATVNPGAEDNFDLAFEYTLTQNWVAVMEGYYSEGQSTRFNGIVDIVSDNTAGVLSGTYYEYALAPALEYNFSSNVGIIGGVWFPVAGKNTSNYIAYVLALNAYW